MSKINLILKKCGVPQHLFGHEYLHEAIKLVLEDRDNLKTSKILYPAIAKKFNTTPSRVEKDIRHAIETAFSNLYPDTIEELFGNTLPISKDRPVNAHFIAALVELVRESEDET